MITRRITGPVKTAGITIPLIFAVSSAFPASQESSDGRTETVILHFRRDSSLIEHDYMHNAKALATLDHIISSRNIDCMKVTAAASPDGDTPYNETLAAIRALSVKNNIACKYPYVNRKRITAISAGEDWNGLRRMIEEDRSTPGRDEALRIFDHRLSGEQMRRQLREIAAGEAYDYISDNMFPYLRAAAVCITPERHNYTTADPTYTESERRHAGHVDNCGQHNTRDRSHTTISGLIGQNSHPVPVYAAI